MCNVLLIYYNVYWCEMLVAAGCEWGDKTPGWCSSIMTEQCYSVESRCCKTCYNRRSSEPGHSFIHSSVRSVIFIFKILLRLIKSNLMDRRQIMTLRSLLFAVLVWEQMWEDVSHLGWTDLCPSVLGMTKKNRKKTKNTSKTLQGQLNFS